MKKFDMLHNGESIELAKDFNNSIKAMDTFFNNDELPEFWINNLLKGMPRKKKKHAKKLLYGK